MAANDMNIKIVYESGNFEVITAPDLSFNDDICFQNEYVDLNNPDEGIFWERAVIRNSDTNRLGSADPTEAAAALDPWRVIHQRTRVVKSENLRDAAAVFVCGVLALARMPGADSECGLKNVLLESMVGNRHEDDALADISDYDEVSAEDYATD